MAGRNPNAKPRDMAISMLVLLVPIALIAWFFTMDPEPEVEAVDVAAVLATAEEESPYPVLRAVNLPEDWIPTRVAWAADGERWINGEPAVGNSWQLGYLAPNEIYVGLQQRDRSPLQFLEQVTREGRPEEGEVELAGREWERWVSLDGRTRSLVWRDGDLAAAVTGDTDFAQLEAFAGSLSEG
ncbi:DUF4245 domain-containing protein [Tessaracoccus sp. OS52]|uniref:DUF4245 domain-containing protein n=1 Tax=Tessaracoccus sp. OS52 TaxID=2886691 RepID=UPI001D116DE9|nr:DUF4245 domain-containing protein [Tessaracoccus sp. OS52]MCC2593557.1 DUF4245 domain-containing protein [Tessaracoccus sp. OS52]